MQDVSWQRHSLTKANPIPVALQDVFLINLSLKCLVEFSLALVLCLLSQCGRSCKRSCIYESKRICELGRRQEHEPRRGWRVCLNEQGRGDLSTCVGNIDQFARHFFSSEVCNYWITLKVGICDPLNGPQDCLKASREHLRRDGSWKWWSAHLIIRW